MTASKTPKTEKTYRPYLTEPEITYLQNLLFSQKEDSQDLKLINSSVLLKLRKLTWSISEGIAKPASVSPQLTKVEMLNSLYEKGELDINSLNLEDKMTMFEYREKHKLITAEERKVYLTFLI